MWMLRAMYRKYRLNLRQTQWGGTKSRPDGCVELESYHSEQRAARYVLIGFKKKRPKR